MNLVNITAPKATYIGWGAIDQLQDAVLQYGQKTLVVSDPVLRSIGILDKVLAPIKAGQIPFDIYTDITPEPTLKTAENLVAHARSGNYGLVIGIGGGSAIDMAKLAAVLCANPGSVSDYLNLSGTKKIIKKGIPKILIPTTAGTGSEVTNIAVMAMEHSKDVIVHEYLLADLAIVDPALTLTVPAKVTAATGADALTHAMEAFISVNANPYSDGLALEAIRLIGRSLKKAVDQGDDRAARIDMAYGSYLAGLSFFNAGVGAIHALAYPLGGQFHIAHGDSNAVLIPYVLSYIRKSCAEKLSLILDALGHDAREMNPQDAAIQCIVVLAKLMKDIGIPETLGGYNIPETACESLAQDGIQQKRLLARCPMALDQADILAIYQAASAGKIFME